MTDLTRPPTTKDITLYVAGKKAANIKNMSITGNSALKDVTPIGIWYKKWQRSFREFSGSMDMWYENNEALGLVLGDYEVDPSKTESVTIDYNPKPITIKHIQGDKTNGQAVATTEKLAQKFMAAGSTLTSAQVYVNSGTDTTVTVSVQADSTGSPSGTPLDSDVIDCSSAGWKSADLSAAALTAGEWYWIVLEDCDTATFAYADTDLYEEWGKRFYSGSWGTLTVEDLAFQLLFTDSSTIFKAQLTDGVTTHDIEGDIVAGTVSTSFSPDEPVSSSMEYKSKEITFSG